MTKPIVGLNGILVELDAINWFARWLSVEGAVYRLRRANDLAIHPFDSPLPEDGELVVGYFRLEYVEERNELMDALVWLHGHKEFRNVKISPLQEHDKISPVQEHDRKAYFIYAPRYGYL